MKYGLDPQEDRLKAGLYSTSLDWSQEEESSYGTLYLENESSLVPTAAGAYQQFFSEMADAIQHNKQVPVEPLDSLQVIFLLELAEKSSQQGKTLMVPGM